jgi:hypothetical protein
MTQVLDTDSDHYLVFDQVGLMAATTTYMHVMLPVNFTAIVQQIQNVNNTLHNKFANQNLYASESYWEKVKLDSQTKKTILALTRRLNKAQAKLDTLNQILPQLSTPKSHRRQRDPSLAYPLPPNQAADSFTHVDHPHLTRHRRWILQILSGIVGTFMGLYTNHQLKTIANKVQDMETTQDLLVHLTAEHTSQINKLTTATDRIYKTLLAYIDMNPQIIYTEFDDVISDIEEKVQTVIGLVQQLQHRRLAINWLTQDQLLLLHDTVLTYTQERNYALLTSNPSDYFQLELSYLRNEEGVVLLLHIPCTTAPDLMTIMRYIPFPIPLHTQTYHSAYSVEQSLQPEHNPHLDPHIRVLNETLSKREALYLIAEADLIAINGNSRYRLLTQSDFAACIQRNHIYLCDKQQILGTDLLQTCLGSLYHKDPKGVRTNCKFERRPLKEEVFQISVNEFLVFSPIPYVSRVHCNNGTSFTADFGQTTRLQIPNGCAITLKSHELSVEESIQVPLPASVTTWRWDPLSLPADLLDNLPNLDSALFNLSVTMHNLTHDNVTRIRIHNLTSEISQVQARLHSSNVTIDYLDHHLISSGSRASILFWATFALSLIAILAGLIFFYRQLLLAKLVANLPLLHSFFPSAPTQGPPPFVDRELDSLPPIIRASPVPAPMPRHF